MRTSEHSHASGSPRRVISRLGRYVVPLCLAAAGFTLAGCGTVGPNTPSAEDPTVRPDELADADGQPCPEELPIGEDPAGHGFGVERLADQLPSLLEPQEAWVCTYDSFDKDTTSSGGAVLGWRLAGSPEPLAADKLPALRAALDELAIPDPDQACTADLGPRYMVVYSHDGDLTGVVVEAYGCRHVRLTDDPHTTPAGADDQHGTVGGILDGGQAVLTAVGSVRP